ncbi:MAG: APC family permease [Rhodanobacteraceae bacterium]
MDLVALLLGRRLANRESGARKIGALEGVPAMGLDALASIAYGPEAALVLLMPLGAAAPATMGWLLLPIIALLGLLCLSYWQTIEAYRDRGGAYVVARENLGIPAGLVAATALMIDYILNVAVGISAGVGALVSVLPGLHPHMLAICLVVLALLTLLNLRGTPESGRALAFPTYLFLACFAGLFALGLVRAALGHGHPQPLQAPTPLAMAASGGSMWLLLRAFASGCTAMTGVEAVSNGMSAFRDPTPRHGHRTLGIIVLALGSMLACSAWLVPAFRIGAMPQAQPGYRSVLAQLAGAIAGDGVFYYVTMASLLAVLVLSANTSFTAFPRLCRNLAQDGYLPEGFAIAGRRLVYSIGLLCLAGCAGALLVAFGGITDRLIPLFAIGAFTGFALSQFGMAAHWRARGGRAMRLGFNAVGGAVTTAALLVMVVAKFREGAWITLFLMAAGYAMLHRVHRYYDRLHQLEGDASPLLARAGGGAVAIVVIERWNRPARDALEFAMGIAEQVVALHLTRLSGPEQKEPPNLRRRWEANVEAPLRAAGPTPPRLRVAEAHYRKLHDPILKLIGELRTEWPDHHVALVLPERVKRRWPQQLMHAHRTRALLRHLARAGVPRLALITLPCPLERRDRGPC